MSKQLLSFCTILLMLVLPIATYAQENPVFVLTEEQINADFTIPSTTTRTISNLEVDVEEDGVQISFDMTVAQNGTTTTYNIIAILIGLVKPRVTQLELENTMISSFTASPSQRREVAGVVARAWGDYMAGVVEENELGDAALNYTKVEALMESDGIYFYTVDTTPIEWCLECPKP
jgi:hypothetical protein